MVHSWPISSPRRHELDELTLSDIELLLESLKYSKMNITHGDAPYELKREKLARIDSVTAKLRAIGNDMRKNP